MAVTFSTFELSTRQLYSFLATFAQSLSLSTFHSPCHPLRDSLDSAFLRRLRFIVDFPFPDAQSRSEIWQRMYPQQTTTRGLDYQRLGLVSHDRGKYPQCCSECGFLSG